MQVQSIENRNNIGFKSGIIEQSSAFVNMDDSKLRFLAHKGSFDKEKEKENQKSIVKTFYAMPIVDVIATGILTDQVFKINAGEIVSTTKATLGDKVHSAARIAGRWTGIIALIGIYNLVKNAVVSNNPTLQEFEKKNGFLSLLADIGIISAGFFLGKKGIDKIKESGLFEKFAENIEKAKDSINASKFNKKIMPKITENVAKISEKAPWAASAGRFALANSIWIILGIAVIKAMKHSKEKHEKVEHNYRTLKKAQFKTAKDLINVLGIENNVLAQNQNILIQNQKIMLKALKKAAKAEQFMSNIKEIKIVRENECSPECISKCVKEAKEIEQDS